MTARTDLPPGQALRRDILLAEQYLGGPQNIFWDQHGRWIQLARWPLPRNGRFPFNAASTPILLMVPGAYGETCGEGHGLEEFYIHPDVRLLKNAEWVAIPHTYTGVDRRSGAALARGWRYLCVHTNWNPRHDNILTALNLVALCLSDPWTFERLAFRNGETRD